MKALRGYLKTMLAALVAMSLIAIIPTSVMAVEVIKFDEKGSICVTITDRATKKGVSGGTLTLYKVADVIDDDSIGYVFDASGTEFAGANGDYSNDESLNADLAADLAAYAKKNGISGTTMTIDGKGEAIFSDLELGLYLIVQNKAAKNYGKVTPFLVSVPQRNEDGKYIYDVDATPKPGTKIDMTPTPTSTPTPTNTPTPTHPPKVPQTGQLWWPVFAMAAAGVVCLMIGFAAKKRS